MTGPERLPQGSPPRPDGSEDERPLMRAIRRVEQTLVRETEALRKRQSIDMDDMNRRKSQGLLELSRVGRRLDPKAIDADLERMLRRLRGTLAENRAALDLYLGAAREISATVTSAIREADSDGTYSIDGSVGF